MYSANLDRTPWETEALASLLSREELERAARHLRPRDAGRRIAARGILRVILSWYLGESPDELRFDEGPRGKPELHGGRRGGALHFNLSHSEGLALYAVTTAGPVGVDVERIRHVPELDGLIRQCCSPGEQASLENVEGEARRLVAFLAAWTRKEALLKATGEGLSGGISAVEVSVEPLDEPRLLAHPRGTDGWSLRHVDPSPGYLGAVALRDEITEVWQRRWP